MENYGKLFIHYIKEKCSALGLETDDMLEDYLGGFSDADFIDTELGDYVSNSNEANLKAEEILYHIEIFNGVRFYYLIFFECVPWVIYN